MRGMTGEAILFLERGVDIGRFGQTLAEVGMAAEAEILHLVA